MKRKDDAVRIIDLLISLFPIFLPQLHSIRSKSITCDVSVREAVEASDSFVCGPYDERTFIFLVITLLAVDTSFVTLLG